MMTIDEVLEKLKGHNLEWFETTVGHIRSYPTKDKPRWENMACPLTALWYLETGEFINVYEAMEAARKLGVEDEDSELFMICADKNWSSNNPRALEYEASRAKMCRELSVKQG